MGSWGGKGASRLGLKGIVDKLAFGRLCENLDPSTGNRLTVRSRSRRTVGYMFAFSVSKSVSLLYGLNRDVTILNAFREAVDESMREMEREMKTRVRKGGQDSARTTGNMVWAELLYATSSPVHGRCDPQLHAFVFVFNMTWDEQEQCWKAGFFQGIKSDAPYFQAAFRVRIANKLQDLGFGVKRKGNDFEIDGIPSKVLKRFSRRTMLIEKVAKEQGISNPNRKEALGPRTRERGKGIAPGLEVLRKEWNSRLTEEERKVLASVYRRETPGVRQITEEAQAVDDAVRHCLRGADVIPERKLVTEALERGVGAVTVEGVTREMASRPLVRMDVAGQKMVALRHD